MYAKSAQIGYVTHAEKYRPAWNQRILRNRIEPQEAICPQAMQLKLIGCFNTSLQIGAIDDITVVWHCRTVRQQSIMTRLQCVFKTTCINQQGAPTCSAPE